MFCSKYKESNMRNPLFVKTKLIVLSSLFIAAFSYLPLQAGDSHDDKITEWISSCPYIGLVADQITYGPITLRDLDLEEKGRIIFVKPDEKINGTVKYRLDSDEMEAFHRHHIIVGLKGQPAECCLTHAYGLTDKKGKSKFSFIAPSARGVYEVCFDYQKVPSCDEAKDRWIAYPPSSNATVGIVIVE